MPRKTAREKLNPPSKLPKQKPAPAIWGGGSMVIPHPLEIRKRMQAVSTGSLTHWTKYSRASLKNTSLTSPVP